MRYAPEPIDTSGITLPDDLEQLTEVLAENVHNIWAKRRMSEGWTYGPVRDDERKEHPDLVPYSELTDSEREYDRRTSMETLKTIIALGYMIEKRRG